LQDKTGGKVGVKEKSMRKESENKNKHLFENIYLQNKCTDL